MLESKPISGGHSDANPPLPVKPSRVEAEECLTLFPTVPLLDL